MLSLAFFLGGCAGSREPVGNVTIASSPESDAEVTVNGSVYGMTPVTIEGLTAGSKVVVITKEGFRRATQTISIPEDYGQRIVVEMEPICGFLTIDSKPIGAQVWLDGSDYIGNCPIIQKKIPIGPHTYELRKPNYKTTQGELTVEEDYKYSFAHELEPLESELSIFSRPSGASIRLNNEMRTETTPAKLSLAPGEYMVGVYVENYIESEQAVVLGANESRSMDFELKPGHVPPGMVLVPAGNFIMGVNGASPDERPKREVYLEAYYIDKLEVTNEQFKAVFRQHTYPADQASQPVHGVSFKQASEYAQAVGKRLPTEEEWEKAARGTDGREYPWGMEFKKELCNSKAVSYGAPIRGGSFRAGVSPYGCLDMAGNVYEWTSSWYQAYPGNKDVTKDYGQVFRVLRGGSYGSDRFGVRAARRHYDRLDATRADYGFRCAKSVD